MEPLEIYKAKLPDSTEKNKPLFKILYRNMIDFKQNIEYNSIINILVNIRKRLEEFYLHFQSNKKILNRQNTRQRDKSWKCNP